MHPPVEPSCVPFRSGEYEAVCESDSNGDGVENGRDRSSSQLHVIPSSTMPLQSLSLPSQISAVCDAF
jgi:hypothetical protein